MARGVWAGVGRVLVVVVVVVAGVAVAVVMEEVVERVG